MQGPGGNNASLVCMGQNCLWDSEEQLREWTTQLICFSLFYRTILLFGTGRSNTENGQNSWSAPHFGRQSLPIPKWGEDQLFSPFSMLLRPVPRGSFIPNKIKEQISLDSPFTVLLFAVPEAVLSHKKSKERHFWEALLTERTVLAGWPELWLSCVKWLLYI